MGTFWNVIFVTYCKKRVRQHYCQTDKTYKTIYCVARNKPISCDKTKLQARMWISLWFCGLLACLTLCCDWSQHNKNNWNISSVPDFVGLIVTFTENCSAMVPGENLALNRLSLLEVFAVSIEPYIYGISLAHRSRNDSGPQQVHTRI